jgi:hypothetical protein
MTLVVILTVRLNALESFRQFEQHAARVMARHGGAIERAVVIPPGDDEDLFREIHIVTFPDEGAFAAYRADTGLADVMHLREESVVSTEVLVGEEGPDYGTSPRVP